MAQIQNAEKQVIKHKLRLIHLAYGFVANPSFSVNHNVFIQLQHMPAWYYFDRPTNLKFHDLTSVLSPPKNLQTLLRLGLKFCPSPSFSHSSASKSLERFRKDLYCKTYFAGKEMNRPVLDMKLYIKSDWCPLDWMIPHPIQRRFRNFSTATNTLFQKKKCHPNLLWHQHLALSQLQKDHRFLIISCDKNLGPAIIERDTYIKRALNDHLLDSILPTNLLVLPKLRDILMLTKFQIGFINTRKSSHLKKRSLFATIVLSKTQHFLFSTY
jgi:hypothetical protein